MITTTNFDVSSMVTEIPSKFNRDKHRIKDGNGIPLEWLDLYPKSKYPQIPNNLITSLNQAINSSEWQALGLFVTKRGKVAEFHSKFLDIVSILTQYIHAINPYTITGGENDIDLQLPKTLPFHGEGLGICVPNPIIPMDTLLPMGELLLPTITGGENDMDEDDSAVNDGFKALSIDKILEDDFMIFSGVVEKVINVLLTPYTIKTKTHQILFRIPNPEFKSENGKNNRKAKWKYAFDNFFRTKRTDYNFINKNLENHFINVQCKKIVKMGDYRILHTEFANWMALTRPTKQHFTQHVHSLIGTKLKGCTITSEAIRPKKEKKKDNKGFIYIEDLIDNANKYAYEGCKPTAFYSSDYFRHYTPYSQSNCVMRSLMTYKGNVLDQCDVASMYPVILLQTYDKRFRVNEFEHDLIMEIINASNPRDILMKWCAELNINITKDEMKVENISYYNMRNADAIHMKLHKMYEKKLPGFAEWLTQLKTKTLAGNKGYWQHRFVSRWLEWQESIIMEPVLIKCYDDGIFAMGIHDGIDVEQGKGEIVAQWIKQSMTDNGYICNVTVNK